MDIPQRNTKAVASRKIKQQSKSGSIAILTPDEASKTSCESSLNRLYNTELARFCPKKLFYIVFLAESDKDSALLLDNFVEVSKNYEEISSVTFITREDVFNLIDTSENCSFPNQLKPLLLDVIEGVKECGTNEVPSVYEAKMVKLKLIQVMYQQYIAQVKQNQKGKNLEDLLNSLSKECRKKQKRDESEGEPNSPGKNKSPTREDAKKKTKKDDKGIKGEVKDEEIDYTSVPLDNNEISFEENIFDYIWFYCIKGFYNNEIFQNLIEQLNVPLCAIIKIIDKKINIDIPDHIDLLWKNVELQFFSNTAPYQYLEDTMLMQFITSNKSNEENVLDLFQDFVFTLRRIVDIRLSHLKYLRFLAVNRIKNIYPAMPLDCMQIYNRSLRDFPLEYISTTLVLDSLLTETCSRPDLKSSATASSSRSLSLSGGSIKSFPSIYCTDPLHDFKAFANIKKKTIVPNTVKENNSFLTHENNLLLKILKFNKHVGPKIYDISLSLMKQIPILKKVLLKEQSSCDDIPHKHDKDPSTKFKVGDEEKLDNFLYLFLFSTFSNDVVPPSSLKEYNLNKNLITFDVLKFWSAVQHSRENIEIDGNLYDTLLVHFRWKEHLSQDVLIQEIFAATNSFSYAEEKYSPETDNFLVVFSDKLDNFGLNTRIFQNSIRTPVCLRDFCRYTTVEETEWLQKNETKIIDESTFKIELNEVCPGAQKIKLQMKIFEEYSYLLDAKIKENDEESLTNDSEKNEEIFLERSKSANLNFEEVFQDLQKYPSHKNLIQECENAPESEQLLSYDLGTNIFKITGHVTTFCSHDGVKVIVDNTRFLQSPEKCTVNVISDGNTMTIYSGELFKKEPYILSLLLTDGSRISFIVKKKVDESATSEGPHLEKIYEEKEEEIKNIVYETSENESIKEEEIKPTMDQVVHCVDEDFLKDIFGDNNVLDYLSPNEDCDELLTSILNAKEKNGVIYKVNTKPNYLKRLNHDLKVPIEHALRNVISRENLVSSSPKPYKIYTKRFESNNNCNSDLEIRHSVDFRICLPNGLFIRAYPCVIDKKNFMIKQEYVEEKPKVSTVQHEEFRLFSYLGFVFIKKIDGTATILKANGDIIDFEKPTDGSGEGNSLKPCHCSTLDDYRNKLNKILKDERSSDYSTSRRGHILHKQNHILDKKLLMLLEHFDVPYLKKSITRFDGKKIKIQGDRITQKQLYHMTSQQDFFTEEIFFERNDDFRSTFERNGSQKIFFPDGTLISISVDIADELVDGFVYVTLSFQYDHPSYSTVSYDFDKTLNIFLNNDVNVKKCVDEENFTVNMQKNILVSVSNEEVLFKKSCNRCQGSFQCNFNIKPFHENTWRPLETFLHVEDTYEKHFYSDFVGNCSRSSEYLKGRSNSLKCNHYKGRDYTKMFIINKDFSGVMFCSNDMIKYKIKEMESSQDASVQTYNMESNKMVTVLDCRQKCYSSYNDRFVNNSVLKYFHHFNGTQQKEVYTTFRIFNKMFQSVEEIQRHVLKIQQVYFSDFLGFLDCDLIFKNIATFKDDLALYYKSYERELLDEQEELERKKRDAEEQESRRKYARCPCAKQIISISQKIHNWKQECDKYKKKIKNKDVPSYFNSDFCKRLK